MRCHAYLLPSETYRGLEAQILEALRAADRLQLVYLLSDNDLVVELLSGEWRVLFEAAGEYYQVVDDSKAIARMAISPDELAEFVAMLRAKRQSSEWDPISFGLADLADALPADCDIVGVVFVEESDDWQWAEPVSEIVAIRPEVYEIIRPFAERLLADGELPALTRLCEDHSEGTVEFNGAQWRNLLEQAHERVPELEGVMSGSISSSADYTSVREALICISDPRFQPSLDAWLRVHAAGAQYVLYFRDCSKQESEAASATGT